MWAPAARDEVENNAAPEVRVTGEPRAVEPSKNVTVPVMVPAVAEVTAAVKVMLVPEGDGFRDDVTAVVVAALVAALTVWVRAGEVLVV